MGCVFRQRRKARAAEAAVGQAVDVMFHHIPRVEAGDGQAAVKGEARVAEASLGGASHGARPRVARGVVDEDHLQLVVVGLSATFFGVDGQSRASLVHEDVPSGGGISRDVARLEAAAISTITQRTIVTLINWRRRALVLSVDAGTG